jgi:hypothetical protein
LRKNGEGVGGGGMAGARPLPIRGVMRACDEFFGEIGAGVMETSFFSDWTRCALRVTGAHRKAREALVARGLGRKQTTALRRVGERHRACGRDFEALVSARGAAAVVSAAAHGHR